MTVCAIRESFDSCPEYGRYNRLSGTVLVPRRVSRRPWTISSSGVNWGRAMRVCFISPYSSRGGAELSLVDLIDALLPLGIECSCIVRSHGAMSEMLADRDVQTIVAPFKPWVHPQKNSPLSRVRKMLPTRQLAGTWRLVGAIKQSGCDLVYTNSITAGAGAMAAKIAGKPHIWHFREFGQDDYQLCYDLGLNLSRYLIRQLSTVCIANSKAVAEAYRPFLAGTELHVVYNAAETPSIDASDNCVSPFQDQDAIRCILPGKYLPGKGQQDAVKAIAALRDMGVPAELLLVGQVLDPGYRQQIERLVAQLDLSDRVYVRGHSDNPVPLIDSADVLLMCSRREAFGRVTVEAMKLGKPVVGTRSGGTPEIIDDGETGLLYEPGDCLMLAQKIAQLYRNPSLREAMGREARMRGDLRFNRQAYGRGIARVIERAMNMHLYNAAPINVDSTGPAVRSTPRRAA